MKVDGLHHVTAITADVEANLDFYARLLGLRLVWQGVNADDPEVRHVAYGDERGAPGSVITFFVMPGVPRGRPGAGMVHRLAMRVADAQALEFWERRLARGGVAGDRLADQLLFWDPDRLALELVIDDGGDEPLLAYAADVDGHVAIRGMHAVRAYSADPAQSAPLLGEVLGMKLESEGTWRTRGEGRHSVLVYDEPPDGPGQVGVAVMAFSAVPSPLYGLYRARDHFSLFMVTVIYAVYAFGVIGALLVGGHLSDWYGRRRLLLPAFGVAIVSAIVFLVSKSLTSLLAGRLLNGIAIGIVVSTATAYLTELHAVGRPEATVRRAQLTASAIPVGGIGVGAVLAGILAQWVAHPLTVPYLVFLGALLLGTVGVALSPETREGPRPRPRYRPQRVSVPSDERSTFFAAALSAFVAFAAIGLLTGLAALFLAVTLHHPSHALAGAVLGAMFAAAVAAQIVTVTWPVTREFEAGMAAMVIGLGLAVLAVWLRPPSLGLFIAGGALIGAGGGTIFRGAVGTVMRIAPPDRIAESLAGMFLATFVGISLPVVGAGITLSRHVSRR